MNAFDEAYQNRVKFDADRAAAEQARKLNDYRLARAPVEDQQADEDRKRRIAAEDKATALSDETVKRTVQLRALSGLKNAIGNGMDVGHALTALGPGTLKLFGETFGDMGQFAAQVKANPKVLDARIAQLTGSGANKKVTNEEYVVGPDGKPGLMQSYEDGTTNFIPGYKKQFAPVQQASLKQDAAGQWRDPYTGQVVANVGYDDVRDLSAAKAEGTAAGKAGEADVAWTPSQRISAKTQLDSLTLKNENLNNAIDKALQGVDWNSAGLVQAFKDAGGPPANLKALLTTVGAQIGLDELTKLKQSGVTLGQVTEAEHALLQSMIANLGQAQDPQQLREALVAIKQQANKAWRITRDDLNAKAQVKGGFAPGGADTPAPAAQTPSKPRVSDKYYD